MWKRIIKYYTNVILYIDDNHWHHEFFIQNYCAACFFIQNYCAACGGELENSDMQQNNLEEF